MGFGVILAPNRSPHFQKRAKARSIFCRLCGICLLVRRRRIRRTAKVDRVTLQQLMTPFEEWQRGAD